ncbi:DoxX family membrane protein [Patescibacteria group bacterium]|nr:DoxX family membrane protein [Patescibacteria group bacterium]
MLNPFPDLLVLSLLAPFILRIVVGVILLKSGYARITSGGTRSAIDIANQWRASMFSPAWYLGAIEIIAGVFLIVGFLTQIAALVGGLIAIKAIARKGGLAGAVRTKAFYVLMLVICVSLLLTGAGALAFDLPL